MYIPKHFAETDTAQLHGLIKTHPFACVICVADGDILVNHLPLILDEKAGQSGVLRGHLARANPLRQQLEHSAQIAVVFQGPQAYVSPSWYPSKQAHGKVVPTWNYAVVHVHGQARVIDDKAWLLQHLNELTNQQERNQSEPWQVADAPADFIDRTMEAIVGVEIVIARLEGKWKLSQNRSAEDRQGVILGLQTQESASASSMAQIMREGII